MRGRNNSNNNNNNNNRRGPNPLTRTYESNGPDVKIRGSAQQIAEKYATLARDAQSSGDRVMAENYLQHAEHYNRIIAAAQAQMPIQNFQQPRSDLDDDLDEEGDEFGLQAGGSSQPQVNGNQGNQPQPRVTDGGAGPQPVIEGVPAEVALNADAVAPEGEADDQPRMNGGENDQASGEEGGFRRPRRPRRGRPRRGEGEGVEASAGEGDAAGDAAPPAKPRKSDGEPSAAPSFEPTEG